MPAAHTRRVAVVGASSLRGRELKEVLEERNFPAADYVLLDDTALGTLTEAGGEPTFIRTIEEDSFDRVAFAFFACAPEFAAQTWGQAQRAGATVIDLSGALAGVPAALPWIPGLEPVLPPPQPTVGKLFYSPAAAAILACRLSAALTGLGVLRLAMIFFQPVSECGQPGIDELEKQTVSLLSFQPIAQSVFDAQVAFNLLSRYGDSSAERLSDVRAAVTRDVVRYIAGRLPLPAIQFVHAPVFYSYVFSAYAELAEPRHVEDLEKNLAASGMKVQGAEEPAPSNVSVAGENQAVLARVDPDPNVPAGYWFWGAADNLRLAAVNAVSIAEKLLAS